MLNIPKFNIYYYGEDNSHCSSCWEPSDEHLWVLLTTLSLEEVKEKFIGYCWSIDEERNFGFDSFLKEVACNGEDLEDNLEYPCIFFEIEGKDYLPDFAYSNIIALEYDIKTFLSLDTIFNKKDLNDLESYWEDNKIKRERREKEAEIKKEEKRKAQEKYEKELKEYNKYLDLEKKVKEFDKIKKPSKPKKPVFPKPNLSKFEKFLEKYHEK